MNQIRIDLWSHASHAMQLKLSLSVSSSNYERSSIFFSVNPSENYSFIRRVRRGILRLFDELEYLMDIHVAFWLFIRWAKTELLSSSLISRALQHLSLCCLSSVSRQDTVWLVLRDTIEIKSTDRALTYFCSRAINDHESQAGRRAWQKNVLHLVHLSYSCTVHLGVCLYRTALHIILTPLISVENLDSRYHWPDATRLNRIESFEGVKMLTTSISLRLSSSLITYNDDRFIQSWQAVSFIYICCLLWVQKDCECFRSSC